MFDERIKKIADKYGFESQSRQLIEEMAELMVAVNKYYRLKDDFCITPKVCLDNKYLLEHISEEIADVTIMLEQIKYLLQIDDSEVECFIKQKLERQIERIEEKWD